MRIWMLILCITVINTSVIGQNKVIDFRNCLWQKGFELIEVSSLRDTIAYIIPPSVPDSVIQNCLSQEYDLFANKKYKERNPYCFNCHLYDPVENNHYPQVKLNYKNEELWLEIGDFSPLKNFQNNLYFTVSYPRHFPIRTIAIAKDPDYEMNWENKPRIYYSDKKKAYNYLKKRDQFKYYELHHDTIKLSYADFEYVVFEEGCFNRMELDTIPMLPNDTLHYSIDQYDNYLISRAYKDDQRKYYYMPSSILKFKNAKILDFRNNKYSVGYTDHPMWIPKGFETLNNLKHFGHICFIPDREKKRILQNKNLKYLSYYYPSQYIKFEKELPDELFEMDSLKSIQVNGDVKNIMKLRKIENLEKIFLYGPIHSNYTYDTINYEFILSEDDKKWIKQHKKLYKLYEMGLLQYSPHGYPIDMRFKILDDVGLYGYSKLYSAPAENLPYTTLVLSPHSTKNYEYHGKRFFVSDSIKTLEIKLCGRTHWQNVYNFEYKEFYRHCYFFVNDVEKIDRIEKQEIKNRFFSSELEKEDSLFHLKFTFRELPQQVKHLDHVEQITMGKSGECFDFYDTRFVFSKYFLDMKALKEVKLYVSDTLIKERRQVWRQEAIANDKYDSEDLSVFSQINAAEFKIIDKLRKKGVKVYYEKIY